MPRLLLILPTGETLTALCITTDGGHEFFHVLNAVRKGTMKDDHPRFQAYLNMRSSYAARLANYVFSEVAERKALVSPPSSRKDADPYRKAILRLDRSLTDLSLNFRRKGLYKAADNATTLDQMFAELQYTPTGNEGSIRSLMIVDESVGVGKTTAAILHHLRAAGLPQDCEVTVVAPLVNKPAPKLS